MRHPKSRRGDTQRPRAVWKYLCVKLTPEDDAVLSQGLAASKALGFATIRTRSAFVRHALYEMAQRNVETARRLAAQA